MTPNNNLNVLPWYSDISKQNHRKAHAYGHVYTLATLSNQLLPFQVRRDYQATVKPITSVLLKNIDGITLLDLTSALTSAGLHIKRYQSNGYDLIIYPANLPLGVSLPLGCFYLEMTDTINTWYSDVMTVVNSTDGFVKITYWDDKDLAYSGGRISYAEGYKNFVYVQSAIGKPEYPFEEEATNRDGYTFVERQVSEKTFAFSFLAPEYLCDALRIVRMHDYIKVESNGDYYDAETFLMTPKWQEQGDLANVDIEFQCDTVVKKSGRKQPAADFNFDFNNDYLIGEKVQTQWLLKAPLFSDAKPLTLSKEANVKTVIFNGELQNGGIDTLPSPVLYPKSTVEISNMISIEPPTASNPKFTARDWTFTATGSEAARQGTMKIILLSGFGYYGVGDGVFEASDIVNSASLMARMGSIADTAMANLNAAAGGGLAESVLIGNSLSVRSIQSYPLTMLIVHTTGAFYSSTFATLAGLTWNQVNANNIHTVLGKIATDGKITMSVMDDLGATPTASSKVFSGSYQTA